MLLEVKVGVVGGFAPAVLKKHVVVSVSDADGSAQVTYKQLTPGKRIMNPSESDYQTYVGQLTPSDVASLSAVVEQIWTLPVESPAGAEDIYRQDTLVHIKKADGKEWVNYSPEGCAHGISTAEANADQRKLFKQIAEAILRVGTNLSSAASS